MSIDNEKLQMCVVEYMSIRHLKLCRVFTSYIHFLE